MLTDDDLNHDKAAVACLYCDTKARQDQTVDNLIASIYTQIGATCTDKNIQPLEKLWEKHLQGQTRPSTDEILSAVSSVASDLDDVYLLIDAFDEIGDPGRQVHLVDMIHHLVSEESRETRWHVMVSSRLELCPFPEATLYHVTAKASEIQTMVREHISRPSFFESQALTQRVQRQIKLRDEITSKIASRASGMFLLAALHLNQIQSMTNLTDLRAALQELPKGTDQVYASIWERVMDQARNRVALARKAILWVCFSKRHLGVEELRHILATRMEHRNFDNDAVSSIDDIIASCKSPLKVDKEGQQVRLVHLTAQTHLEERLRRSEGDIDGHMTRLCLTYLTFEVFQAAACEYTSYYASCHEKKARKIARRRFLPSRLEEFPFLNYAANYWGFHARGQPENTCQTQIIQSLLMPNVFENMVMIVYEGDSVSSARLSREERRAISPRVLATYYSLGHIVKMLDPEKGIYREPLTDPEKQTMYHLAVGRDDLTIVQYLLRCGIEIDAPDIDRRTALQQALEQNFTGMTQLLLENDGGFASPMEALEDMVLSETLDLLATSALETRMKQDRGHVLNLILERACYFGKSNVMSFALDKGAEVDHINHEGRTVLSEAIRISRSDIVKLLVSRGALCSANSIEQMSPLQEAAKSQFIFKARLYMGQDLDSCRNRRRLRELTDSGSIALTQFVKRQFEKKIDPRNLLYVSKFRVLLREDKDQANIMGLLLAHGADPHEVMADGATITHLAACSEPRLRMLKVLGFLKPHARDNSGRTALQYAVALNRPESMRYLITEGADVLSTDSKGAALLHYSIKDLRCMKIAFESGCRVQENDRRCRTPYHYAMMCEEVESETIIALERLPGLKTPAVDVYGHRADYYRDKLNGPERQTYCANVEFIEARWYEDELSQLRIHHHLQESEYGCSLEQVHFSKWLSNQAKASQQWTLVACSDDEE